MSDKSVAFKRYKYSVIFFGLYLANVIITKIQIASDSSSPVRINDVGEFLLLFAASIAFVIASLNAEKAAK